MYRSLQLEGPLLPGSTKKAKAVMIIADIKSKGDENWNSSWTGGLLDPQTVLEHLTLLGLSLHDKRNVLLAENKIGFWVELKQPQDKENRNVSA